MQQLHAVQVCGMKEGEVQSGVALQDHQLLIKEHAQVTRIRYRDRYKSTGTTTDTATPTLNPQLRTCLSCTSKVAPASSRSREMGAWKCATCRGVCPSALEMLTCAPLSRRKRAIANWSARSGQCEQPSHANMPRWISSRNRNMKMYWS